MRTIDTRPVRFGELAGPLVHGSTIFDWQIRALEDVVAAFDCPFPELIAEGRIPHAPVAVDTSVHRYPTLEDVVTVEAAPVAVGDSSLELRYGMTTEDGESLWTARATHVTIDAEGSAVPLPERVRREVADALAERPSGVGPSTGEASLEELQPADPVATVSATTTVRSPHTEGVSWAYFEEYPRLAAVALESFLEERGVSPSTIGDGSQPFRMRDWRWEFRSPVPLGSTLTVEGDVLALEAETIRVVHTFTRDGEVAIRGLTEYGCFDRTGEPVAFDETHLAPFTE